MKVAHIITRMIIGGAMENTLHNLTDHYRDYGDEPILLTGPTEGPEGSLMDQVRQVGFDYRIVTSLRRSVNPLDEYRAYRQLVRLLRETKPDLVHTHTSKAGILGRMAASKAGIPCVHTIHGASFHYGQHPAAYRLYRGLEKYVASSTAHYISVCDKMTDIYVSAGIAPREKFTTIYSGFDTEPFLKSEQLRGPARQKLGFQEDDLVVGKIGRLFPLKGHECLIAASKDVIEAFPRVKFLLIGDGILREKYELQIRELGLQSHFVLTGMVAPEEIPGLIAASDIVVHASQWEGLARVLPQALMAGRPVVSFDIDGAPEVVKPGQTGLLVKLNDVSGLSQAIKDLAGDAELRKTMGERGRALCTEKFDHRLMSARIRDVYEQVLRESGGS